MWVILATVAAGALIGFVTGGARISSAGHVTSGVTGFFVGAFAARADSIDLERYAQIFCLYIFTLFATYVLANILRHKKSSSGYMGNKMASKQKRELGPSISLLLSDCKDLVGPSRELLGASPRYQGGHSRDHESY